MLTDREANRRLEWDIRNGVISRKAAGHGLATPISDVVVPLAGRGQRRARIHRREVDDPDIVLAKLSPAIGERRMECTGAVSRMWDRATGRRAFL